jgi:hypothetical protein
METKPKGPEEEKPVIPSGPLAQIRRVEAFREFTNSPAGPHVHRLDRHLDPNDRNDRWMLEG